LPWLVLVISLAGTTVLWKNEQDRAQEALQRSFNGRLSEAVRKIERRMQTHADVLRGVQALFAVSADISATQFRAYVMTLNLAARYPGIYNVNLTLYVPSEAKATHIDAMRRRGLTDYTIKPDGVRNSYAPIIYIEPAASSNSAFGYDTYFDPTRRIPRDLARDTGEAIISSKLKLLTDGGQGEQAGFLMSLPVYQGGMTPDSLALRRSQLYGWVGLVFRTDDLMREMLGESAADLAIQVYDGDQLSSSAIMFDSGAVHAASAAKALFAKNQPVPVAGHVWTIAARSLPAFEAHLDRDKSQFALVSGLCVSLLLFLTSWLLLHGQARARQASARMARELAVRKQVEAAAAAGEIRLHEIIDILPIALFIKDPASRFTLLNRAFELQFGLRAADMIGADGKQFFAPEQWEKFLHMDRAAFEGGVLVEFDQQIWSASHGEYRYFHAYKKPVFDASGAPQYLICMTVDITERTRAETRLKLLETCVSRLNDVVLITEAAPLDAPHGPRILFVNDAFEKRTGYPREEVIGQTPRMLQGPNTSRVELDRINAALRQWQPVRSQLINYTKSGEQFWMELDIVPIADANGAFTHWVAVERDISERKQAEEAMLASLAMHRAVIDHAPLAMLVTTMATDRIVYANHRFAEMCGLSITKLVGRLAADFYLQPVERNGMVMRVRQCGYVNDDEVMLRPVALDPFWAMVSTVQTCYEGMDSLISGIVDISAIKTIQEDLRVARQRADSANQAKSAFLSNMSHEIRTPMNSILGMAYLARQTALDAQQRDYLDKINHSGQHLLELIDDILDFSKIEAGMLSIECIPFTLDAVICKLNNLMAQRMSMKGIAFTVEVDADTPAYLRGDPLRLSQILINLTSNALKFTEAGAINVTVRPLTKTAGSCLLRFDVTDSGIGLAECDLANLFESFQQADASSSRRYGGSGLGLAISKQLTELMCGTIGVSSVPEQGSTFWFTARLLIDHVPLQAGLAAVPCTQEQERAALAGTRILVADDSALNQQVAMEMLQGVGATVSLASNGHEVLALLRVQRFEAVLMDVQMPGMDGVEATRQIRADPALDGVLIIALTASASTQERRWCLDAGMNDFISKPIKPALLYGTLARCLAQRPATALDGSVAQAGPSGQTQMAADLVDLSKLIDIIGNDPAQLRKFVLLFLASSQAQMARIEAALQAAELDTLISLGHGLRGEVDTMGAAGLTALCVKLEQLKAGGDLAQASQIVLDMRWQMAQVRAHLAVLIHGPAGADGHADG
jgi:PAS domain S-box-containing protein